MALATTLSYRQSVGGAPECSHKIAAAADGSVSVHFLNSKIQAVLNAVGYEMRRKGAGVSFTDPYVEQARLLSGQDVKVVFEVGAADGRDALRYAELFPRAEVFAFEPVPKSFATLRKACEANPRVRAFQCAMSNSDGRANFNIGAWEDASSLYRAQDTGSTFDKYNAASTSIEVNVRTITSFAEEKCIDRIDLLKMDAQGAELDILRGADDFINERKIAVIYTEVQFMQLYEGAPQFDKLMTYLLERGYQLHKLYGLTSNQDGQLAWGDAIFIREEG